MLDVERVCAGYGKVQVVWNVSLQVKEGEVVAILGPNGAGKTTLLNTITGHLRPMAGRIVFRGEAIEGTDPHRVAERGIAYVPQGGGLFQEMTVLENLELGAYSPQAWRTRRERLEWVCQLFPVLKERQRQMVRSLSGGERQMVAIARALMACPQLLILDEVSWGLAPRVVAEVFQLVQQLRASGVTVLLVEQSVQQALETADRAYVMENGRIVLEGTREELLDNELIRTAYLGL
ncbi:MAG: ABC transporter ATP-binding protein [Armatimonadota bacterium]|nr:ABC transporter ATP-binding protein [Armatimonadota bacterium]MDR7439871.1 ABC transporter ATP-binding protein [Armatimonadota bacterium]MDR7563334.1 ABC transporter ATP-binding protein [Armatimonadota bacterium]MDR7567488.1 ABC transporter ATP-binding protein [Armatimonadota bacterium]MDR7601963.1 ABC transporter ATP-binding protein [Armatimonadota bacterium]